MILYLDLKYIRKHIPDAGSLQPCTRRNHTALVYNNVMLWWISWPQWVNIRNLGLSYRYDITEIVLYLYRIRCDKVCLWLAIGRWFSLGTPVSSINKTDCHDITEINKQKFKQILYLSIKMPITEPYNHMIYTVYM